MVLTLQSELKEPASPLARAEPLTVRLSQVELDGRRVDLSQPRSFNGGRGAYASSIAMVPGDMVIPILGGRPVKGSVLSMKVDIEAPEAQGLVSLLLNGY
ncbi:hypothetical protein BN844_2000 [Pseudomonas sp. SHC52]|nr:hypothetical protein BN844_2000 [Pseudomonas sp. SHC52]